MFLMETVLRTFEDSATIESAMYWVLSGVVTFACWKFLQAKFDSGEGEIPQLTFQESDLSRYLLKHCKVLTKPFKPPFYARNRHIQTILPLVLPKPKYEFKREYVPMDDGGQVALDWGVTGSENAQKDTPILIVLPGLTGDNRGFKPLCKRAAGQGLRPLVFNKRGHGNSVLTTPKLQSFGDTTDFRTAVLHIRKLYPDAKIVAVGHSAGSGLLACYLGTFQYDSQISAACCVSPGYDGVKLFSNPLPWPYDYLLLRGLKNLVRQHAQILSEAVDVKHVLQSKNIKEFDYRLYCKIYGIRDIDEYWVINNPANTSPLITVPTLCINSLNDPVFPKWVIPFDLFRVKPNALLLTIDGGGHCGFVHGIQAERWNFIVAVGFLVNVVDFLKSREK